MSAPSRSHRRHPHRPTEVEQLAVIAELVDRSFAPGKETEVASIVRVTDPSPGSPQGQIDLGVRPLDDAEGGVIDALLGFDAPASWRVIGVVTNGRAHQHGGDADRADDDQTWDGERVRLVHLVGRGGASASVVRVDGHAPQVLASADAPPDGRLDEVCRRALGLPTAAADVSPQALWVLVWLDRILAAAATAPLRRPALGWPDVAALHPAAEIIAATDPMLAATASEHLQEMANAMVLAWSWDDLRLRCATDRWDFVDIPSHLAAWMDDGMFARWALATYPEIEDLLAAVEALLPRATFAPLVAMLDWWRLIPGPAAAAS